MNTIFEVERELLIKQIPYSLFEKDSYIELKSNKYGRIRITETDFVNKFSVIRKNDVLVSYCTLKEVIDFVKKYVKPVEPVECTKIDNSENLTDTQLKISEILDAMKDLLLYKNKKYGDSAINPKKIFYKGDSTNSILIRLDDKIGRVMSHTDEKPRTNDVADIIGYCTLLLISMGVTPEDIAMRRAQGYTTTFYVCCNPSFPNTFTTSQPYEAELLGWKNIAHDYDGFLRWAYNSWAENPQYDSRFGNWMSGDTYFVYPYNRSSIRFERLIDGIEVSEKIRALRVAAADMSGVDAVLEKVRTMKITDYEQPWRDIVIEARKALDDASRK